MVIRVRPRTSGDLEALEALAATLKDVDGYPPPLGRGLFPAAPAWVACSDDALVGHVAVHESTASEAMDVVAKAAGCTRADLLVVSRLFVAIDRRRAGIGRMLLDVAVTACHERGRRPMLDVSTDFAAAIALYERAGWERVGDVVFPYVADGIEHVAHSYAYLGPAPPDQEGPRT